MWTPESESQRATACDEKSINECHWLEAKSTTRHGNAARAETARDISSFALDGGAALGGSHADANVFSYNDVSVKLKPTCAYACDTLAYAKFEMLARDEIRERVGAHRDLLNTNS